MEKHADAKPTQSGGRAADCYCSLSSTLKASTRLCSTFICFIVYIVLVSFKVTVVECVKL